MEYIVKHIVEYIVEYIVVYIVEHIVEYIVEHIVEYISRAQKQYTFDKYTLLISQQFWTSFCTEIKVLIKARIVSVCWGTSFGTETNADESRNVAVCWCA